MSKIETEKQTVEAMIRLYCKGKKHTKTENYRESQNCPSNPSNLNNLNTLSSLSSQSTPITPITPISPIPAKRSSAHPLTVPHSPLPVPPLCPQCQALLDYAHKRLEHCKFGEDKPSCTRCPVHCYKPAMRQQIRQVMRYSGPRMLLHNPVFAIRHLWDFLMSKIKY
ncbi:MAG: nitrous oxide-stimulated promoter family protein [Bacteroidaceae bacterium]|nr:nitrous oxide-stimulated promoter family protein [Bacteroidaceae bacterium]